MMNEQQRLDGNAAGGILGQIFAVEMTSAQVTCAGCSHEWSIGATVVYATPMGTIIRCPGCDTALIRIAQGPQRLWVDLSGARLLLLHTNE